MILRGVNGDKKGETMLGGVRLSHLYYEYAVFKAGREALSRRTLLLSWADITKGGLMNPIVERHVL